MGYTVVLPYGNKDSEFETYARLLKQRGKDLSCLPRVPDPSSPHRRWAYVWGDPAAAEEFAAALRDQTGVADWVVRPADAPPSEGPFGPVLAQLARRSDRAVLALHPLSRAMLRSAFPDARIPATTVDISRETWSDFLTTHGNLADLLSELMAPLTGLDHDRLADLGYAVLDADVARTWVYVPPAGTLAGQA